MKFDWLKDLLGLKIFPKLKDGKVSFSILKGATFIKVVNKPVIGNKIVNGIPPIVWDELTPEQQKRLKDGIYGAFKEGAEVLEATYADNAENYVKEEKTNEDNDLVVFFEGKIPAEDLYSLKASLYIHKLFKEGKDIHDLKKQLRYSNGQRGINICNLYSAGYFRTWIKPLYENSAPENFKESYEIVIVQSPFAIFVNADMTVANIEEQIKVKVNDSQLYGIKTVNVHGIGSDNINKIFEAIKNLSKTMDNIHVEYETVGMFVAKIEIIKKEDKDKVASSEVTVYSGKK